MTKRTRWISSLCLCLSMAGGSVLPVMALPAPEVHTIQMQDWMLSFVRMEMDGQPGLQLIRARSEQEAGGVLVLEGWMETEDGMLPVRSIAAGAFFEEGLEAVQLPDTLMEIEPGAFTRCQHLQTIQIPDWGLWQSGIVKDCPQASVFVPHQEEAVVLFNEEPEEEAAGYAQTQTEQTTQKGWVRYGTDWKYAENGSFVTNAWKLIDGQTYYFLSNGCMARGWQKLEGSWYYFASDGRMVRSKWIGKDYVGASGQWIPAAWGTQDGKLCWILGDGTRLTNAWKKKDGSWYWLDAQGYVFAGGWKTIAGKEYYFEADGKMAANTWKNTDGGSKYLDNNGESVRARFMDIQNETYYFDGNGYMKTGFVTDAGITCYAGQDGRILKNMFLRPNGNVYYADASGTIVKHVFRIDGVRFIPSGNGIINYAAVNDTVYTPGSAFSWNDAFGSATFTAPGTITSYMIQKLGQPAGKSLSKTIDGQNYQLIRFPMKTMKITQGANGSFSHTGVTGLDLAGKDTGTDPVYAPVDMHLVYQNSYEHGNALFFESDQPVLFADGTIDYATFMFLHDSYVGDLKTSYKQWEEFGDEGVAGYATGNHLHFEVAKGRQSRYYYRNVFGTLGLQGSVPADQACVIDEVTLYENGQPIDGDGLTMSWKKAADVKKAAGLTEKPAGAIDQQGKFWVTVRSIRVRLQPGLDGKEAGYSMQYGDHVVYDCYLRKDGYIWLGFIDKNGNRRWVASGAHNGTDYTDRYGNFEP